MRTRWCLLIFAITLSSCQQISFQSKPLPIQHNTQAIIEARPEQSGFQQYVAKQAPHLAWPIQHWDLQTLTFSALYFHPALKVAKSDYAVALAGITAAGVRPLWGLNGLLSKSNQANGDISPFLYNLQIDIPVVTNGKREINLEIAKHQADIAKIQLAEMAWQLRYQLSVDILDRAELLAMQANWQQLYDTQTALLQAYEKRLNAGMTGKVELLPIQLQTEQTQWQLTQAQHQLQQITQKIVHDAGLTGQSIPPNQLVSPNLESLIQQVVSPATIQADSPLSSLQQLRTNALTNRMDIQRGLAQYAQAESKLKLEIAKLKPDISVSPGIAFEFGDQVWSLGIGSLLNMLNRTSDLWKQADAVRANEADRFYALQQHIIQQCEQQYGRFHQTWALYQTLSADARQQPQRLHKLEQQWRAGLIDKTEWLLSMIQFYTLQQRLISQQISLLRSVLEIEQTMQIPFLFPAATYPMTALSSGASL